MRKKDFIFKVCYNPNICFETMKLIEETVEPELINKYATKQYNLNEVVVLCSNMDEIDYDYLKNDLQKKQNVEYIEF